MVVVDHGFRFFDVGKFIFFNFAGKVGDAVVETSMIAYLTLYLIHLLSCLCY